MVKVSEYKTYLVLYVKSILYLWKTSPFNILILIITIPIQALLPSLSLYIANILINRMNNLSQQLLFLLLGVWGVAFLLNNIFTPLTTMIQGKLTDTVYFNAGYICIISSSHCLTHATGFSSTRDDFLFPSTASF